MVIPWLTNGYTKHTYLISTYHGPFEAKLTLRKGRLETEIIDYILIP